MSIASLTLKVRLSIMIATLLLLAVGIGALGLLGINKANDGLKTVYEDRTVALEQVSRIDRLLLDNRLALSSALLEPNQGNIDAQVARIEKNAAEITAAWKDYMATYLTPEESRIAHQFAQDREKWLVDGLQPALAALRAGQIDAALGLQSKFQALIPPVRDGVNALRKLQVDVAREEYEQAQVRYLWIRNLILLATAFGALAAAAFGFLTIRSVYRQLGGEPDYAAQIVHSIAAGDLTVEVATKTEDQKSLLYAMKTMQQKLAETVGEIRRSTSMVATASSEIASGNLDLSARTEQQAGALQETASSMEELTATVRQNADAARQANQLAVSASDVAQKGGAVVAQVVSTMNAINASANKIVDIISVIDGIAFQTNILALNAAVEAARAGEQGRGFAVVAAEVRNLAQRSASAAKEIKALINDSVKQVDSGNHLVAQAGTTMDELLASVKRVTDIMGEIRDAGQEQSAGIEQINQAIASMDDSTQKNTALVEESSAAATSLSELAANLERVVKVFKVQTSLPYAPASAAKPAPAPAPAMRAPAHADAEILTLPKKAPHEQLEAAPPATQVKRVAHAKRTREEDEWVEF